MIPGSPTKSNVVANAMAKSLQTIPFTCCWTAFLANIIGHMNRKKLALQCLLLFLNGFSLFVNFSYECVGMHTQCKELSQIIWTYNLFLATASNCCVSPKNISMTRLLTFFHPKRFFFFCRKSQSLTFLWLANRRQIVDFYNLHIFLFVLACFYLFL